MSLKDDFNDSSNFEPAASSQGKLDNCDEVSVSQEPVDGYDISQCSQDEVTDTKVSEPEARLSNQHYWRVGDECSVNGSPYIIRGFKTIATIDAVGDKYSYDENINSLDEKTITPLSREIDNINAYLEQIDSNLSDYDVQMFAQYVIGRIK
jgi:hypothetical protein